MSREIHWWQRGAIYQVYPRSFSDSDGDGVGDLRGVVDRLDYLNDGDESSLGVEAVWLSPFYPSPMADFGYDVCDYTDVDPLFGTLADFDELVREAHRRGIKVVIDWVPNHTSERHPWFVDSRSARDSAKRDWYVWRDPAPDGGPPNNWSSSFDAVGPAWTLDEHTGQYYLHSFTPQQPDLNWDNPEVEAAMHGTLRFWLDRGVDGFRMDVIHRIAKDPEFADNPASPEPGGPAEIHHDQDWPTIHERLRRIRSVLDEYEDRMMVGEVHIYDLGRLVEYIASGDQLHLAHNFVFMYLPWDAAAMRASVDEFEALSGDRAWPAWFLENHDHSRVASRFGGGEVGEARARVAVMLLYTLRGTPFIYQGEELGLPDALVPPERVVDVDGRDPERAPIPWEPPSSAGPGAGFTAGDPWLPLVAEAERLNAESESEDPDSILNLVRRLAWLRRGNECLQCGEQRSLEGGPGVLAYLREWHGHRMLVLLNFSAKPCEVSTEELPAEGVLEACTHRGRDGDDPKLSLAELTLDPNEGVLLRV
jgi:alpha-glucosidase